jgi:hypothetical protein
MAAVGIGPELRNYEKIKSRRGKETGRIVDSSWRGGAGGVATRRRSADGKSARETKGADKQMERGTDDEAAFVAFRPPLPFSCTFLSTRTSCPAAGRSIGRARENGLESR